MSAMTLTNISRGHPRPFIDALGNVFSAMNKLIFLNVRFENHQVDPALERSVRAFVEEHQLYEVQVRLNEYAPLEELGRLFTNGNVNIFLRLFFGLPLWLAYTLNVGRIFGGDHYNPYSNTANIYSGHEAIALHELGHALDFQRRRFPGLYSLLRYIPGVALYQEYLASLYAIEFLQRHDDKAGELRAFRLLFPAYSTYVFGALFDFFPSALVKGLMWPIIVLGHLLGNAIADQRADAMQAATSLPCPSVRKQWLEEWGETVTFLSPSNQSGKDFLGVSVGLALGTSMCGVMALPGAYFGYWLARSEGREVARPHPQIGSSG